MYSFMAGIFNVLDNDPIDSSLHQLNVYRIYFGGDCDEKPEFELNRQINVLDYWSKCSIQYSELSFFARHLLKIPISIVASKTILEWGRKLSHL
ncbi:hypothetical protein Goarm_000571 [Gossypium armourianum]|uniref:HAT C-terminal dimerisation domain-containing protein n=1 Tax=Gossypium armourianum TaxID=34283 RepID=A0A7J9KA80_9ROSI|nr:hypothetical protein [Gossypium armourianum]